jgi:hypothetical protein
MRDSINLAWKLDLVLRGVCGEELLDTYELERSPHARVLIEGSIALGRVACERDPEAARQRDEAYRSGNVPPPPDDPTLLDGILHRDESGELGPLTAQLIEQGIVRYRGETGRFDDLVGWGFHLIGMEFDPRDQLDAEQLAFLDSINCKVVQVTNDPGVEGAVLDLDRTYEAISKDADGATVFLSRPDFSIFGAGFGPEDVPLLVDDLRKQLKVQVGDPAAA